MMKGFEFSAYKLFSLLVNDEAALFAEFARVTGHVLRLAARPEDDFREALQAWKNLLEREKYQTKQGRRYDGGAHLLWNHHSFQPTDGDDVSGGFLTNEQRFQLVLDDHQLVGGRRQELKTEDRVRPSQNKQRR